MNTQEQEQTIATLQATIEELNTENEKLRDQVRRHVRTEQKLQETQRQIDSQIQIYRQLYELGQQYNTAVDEEQVLQIATSFVLYSLNFERCLILLHQQESEIYHVVALDGYYEEGEEEKRNDFKLSSGDPALHHLQAGQQYALCTKTCNEELRDLCDVLGMDEFVLVPMRSGASSEPMGLLIAGNTEKMAPYQTRVSHDSQELLGLGSMINHTIIALTNAELYQQLDQERRNLEQNVQARTQELAEAQETLQQRYMEAEKAAEERQQLQDELIRMQEATLRELSTPLIPISDSVVLMPLIGSIDTQRMQLVMEALLEGIALHQADTAIIDITGVRSVDTQATNGLMQTVRAAGLLGTQVVMTGISPAMAQTLVILGADMSNIVTRGSLKRGIAMVLGDV